MAHHVKAFWIGHHIVCACLIALTDALMFAMLAFCWQRAWRHCVFRDEMMTESSMRVVPPLSHMFVSGNPEWVFYYPEWVFYCWYCPGTRVFANSSLPDCQVIADLWSCLDEPVMPVRCHNSLRKSRVLHATNDSMWNAGKGLAWLFLLLSAMSTYVDEQNCTGSCSSCSIRRWSWLLACESDAWIASMYQTWWLPFRVFRVEVLRFTVACLFPVNTYPVWKRLLNTTMNDAWEHGCECEYIPHIMIPPASSRERMVYAVSTENIFHAYGKG